MPADKLVLQPMVTIGSSWVTHSEPPSALNVVATWLRQELLVVTKHLASLLESSNLSDTDQRLRAPVYHLIVRDSEDVGLYRNSHSRTLGSYLGNNY